MAGRSVVVLGGGVGGLVVANLLRDKLENQAEITLVDRKAVFEFPPSYPWVMLGQRRPEQVQRPLGSLERKGTAALTLKTYSPTSSWKLSVHGGLFNTLRNFPISDHAT